MGLIYISTNIVSTQDYHHLDLDHHFGQTTRLDWWNAPLSLLHKDTTPQNTKIQIHIMRICWLRRQPHKLCRTGSSIKLCDMVNIYICSTFIILLNLCPSAITSKTYQKRVASTDGWTTNHWWWQFCILQCLAVLTCGSEIIKPIPLSFTFINPQLWYFVSTSKCDSSTCY